MGRADLHIHTTASFDGTASVSATLAHVATQTNLDVIAITDHDEIDGALEALAIAPRYGVQVIPGIEVSTREGHLLALDVQRMIPRGLPLTRTLELIGEEGGYAVAPHPGGQWAGSLSYETIAQALASVHLRRVLIGAEEFNGSLPLLRANRAAAAICKRTGLAHVGNSDAHMLWMISLGCTTFPGSTAADLRRAIEARRTGVEVQSRPWYFLASFAHRQTLRGLGLAQWSALEPGAPIGLRRLAAIQRAALANINLCRERNGLENVSLEVA
ncbi:MAG: PHP-associated domain-containing protein [Caldilineaceae bacterium]